MKLKRTKTIYSFLRILLGAICVFALAGCSQASEEVSEEIAEELADEQQEAVSESGEFKVKIGTLPTEDILPYWVADDEDIFDRYGIDAEVVTFQSATELISGVQSGSVDLAMTDPMVAASIYASGTEVQMLWVTLGLDASQGRFGIMTSESSGITSVDQLKGVPIGVGSNTVLEYMMDTLLTQAGFTDDEIVVEELQKLPVRYQAMQSGQVAAAALPNSLLSLGEANGCITLIDDTQGDNITQSVMIARSDWYSSYADYEVGTSTDKYTALEALTLAWDECVSYINANPELYRETLVEEAQLSEQIASSYTISTYPLAQLPTSEMIDPVLEWMEEKGYLTKQLAYNESDGTFSAV